MPIKDNSNKITETAEMVFDSLNVGFGVASLAQPLFSVFTPIFSLSALPFAMYNQSLAKKQVRLLVDGFNNLETRLDKLEKLNEEQKRAFQINGYKIIDCCLREKMKEKIDAYAKILSSGINSGDIFEQNDLFDIQVDIINSLRMEDIALCIQLIDFAKQNEKELFAFEFQYDELEAFVVFSSNEEKTVSKYALKHLVNLGLLDERIETSAAINDEETVVFNDRIIHLYSLTQRFRMIYQLIVSPIY